MFKGKKIKFYKREKINLFLKNPLISKKFLTGVFKKKINNKKNNFIIPTHYSNQLKEKRKLKIIYGISDKKYNIYYSKSKRIGGDIFKNILYFLESRLDNIIYRIGLSLTRAHAKQMISHGFIRLNGIVINFPSKILSIGDLISYNFKYSSNHFNKKYFTNYYYLNYTPSWIFTNFKKFSSYLKRLPTLEELKLYVNIKRGLIFGNCNI